MLEPLTCPQCGAPLRAGANKCDYCDTGFVGVDTQALITQAENKFEALRFEISAQEMASAIARLVKPLPVFAENSGSRAALYAYDSPVLEVDE